MLAGVIKGWADPALLDAYEIEWRPITDQVSRHAMRLATTWERRYGAIPKTIEEPGRGGNNVRRRIGRAAAEIMVQGRVLRRAQLRLFLRRLARVAAMPGRLSSWA
jgi:hypothetical protein